MAGLSSATDNGGHEERARAQTPRRGLRGRRTDENSTHGSCPFALPAPPASPAGSCRSKRPPTAHSVWAHEQKHGAQQKWRSFWTLCAQSTPASRGKSSKQITHSSGAVSGVSMAGFVVG